MENEASSKARQLFSKEEDNMIKQLYEEFGMRNWNRISQFLPARKAKNCRDRYLNYLQPNLKTEDWTAEEDSDLLKLVQQYGKKWMIISELLPGRSPISTKNRFTRFLENEGDKDFVIPKENKCRTARLALPDDFDCTNNVNDLKNANLIHLFEQIFSNESDSSERIFFDF
jgi:hypothetical protein